MLSLGQRVLYGYMQACNIAIFLDSVALFYYNDEFGVSTAFLGIASVIVGCFAAYHTVLVGNLSDRAKGKYRRKPYILIFGPMYAVGVFFRISALTSKDAAGYYYVFFYLIQMLGASGFKTALAAWGQELARTNEERSQLFTVATFTSLLVSLVGLVILFLPLPLGGAAGGLSILLASFLGLVYLPDNTPMEKRSFIPTVTNISSVLWNSQFRIYLGADVFISVINSVTPLLLFFFRFAMDLSQDEAKQYNTACLMSFFIAILLSSPVTPYFLRKYGKLTVLRTVLLILTVYGFAMLGVSYWSPIGIVIGFAIVGFVITCAGISVGIISADVVDYDELLCGKKRSSSYQAVLQPIGYFVGIASSSIPLAIMSATGFEEEGDDDTLEDDGATSTYESTITVRLWCTVMISVIMFTAWLFLRNFKIDNDTHDEILAAIKERDGTPIETPPSTDEDTTRLSALVADVKHMGSDALEDNVESFRDRSVSGAPLTTIAGIGELPPFPPRGRPLSSVVDPLTRQPVEPPPYAQVMEVIDNLTDSNFDQKISPPMTKEEIIDVRFLGYYFPRRLHLCCTAEGQKTILGIAVVRSIVATILFILSFWQAVKTIIDEDIYKAYLMVFLTLIYSVYFIYQVLFYKGWRALIRARANPRIMEVLRSVSAKLQELERERRGREAVDENSPESPLLGDVKMSSTHSGYKEGLFNVRASSLVRYNVISLALYIGIFVTSMCVVYLL